MRRDTASAFEPFPEQELEEAQNNLNRCLPQGDAEFTAKVLGGCIALNGTQGAVYLAGRGIPSDSLPIIDSQGDLLFHPSLWHKETKQTLPAVVCRLRDERGEIACAQHIYLQKGQPQRLMHRASLPTITSFEACLIVVKGYKREQFADAWSRYASPSADSAIQTATPPHPNKSTAFSENQTATNDSMWRFENGQNVNESEACGVVADWSAEEREQGDTRSEAGCARFGEPSKKVPETHQPVEPPPMPKCSICGSSIPINQDALPTGGGGLAHRSCIELGSPTRRH